MKSTDKATYKTEFDLKIPNINGDGVAEVVKLRVDVWRDEETGEEILTPESLELIDKAQARLMGLLSPEQIGTLRVRLNLTQNEMSELLQIGEKTYTRWESGRARPSRSMNVLLCALKDGRIDIEYLRSLRQRNFNWFQSMPALVTVEDKPSKLWASLMERNLFYYGFWQEAGSIATEVPLFTLGEPAWLLSTNQVYNLLPGHSERTGIVLTKCRAQTSEPSENAELEMIA
jgi:DNA-binding transcriptional regulator YiaG